MLFWIRVNSRRNVSSRRFVGSALRAAIKRPVDLFLDKIRILQQPDDLAPHQRVKKILAHWSVVAQGPTEVAPRVGTEAAVVIDLAGARARRRSIERVATFSARHQTLHHTRRDRATRGMELVGLKPLLSQREGFRADNRRHRNLDPLLSWLLVAGAVAWRDAAAEPDGPRDTLAPRRLRLAEAGGGLCTQGCATSPKPSNVPSVQFACASARLAYSANQ